jgi:cytochrome oxidase Cu insertion factor (SCO1/SenC/PrrC family)
MNEQQKARRKKIATLTVVLPLLAGIIIVLLGHFLGNEHIEIPTPKETTGAEAEAERQAAPALAAAGTPAPRIRLSEGATGKRFDSASLGDEGFAVGFISTKCEPIGDYLGRVTRKLEGSGGGDVLAISANPEVDTPQAVRGWLAKHHIPTSGPFHYLVGDEEELSGYWSAFGFPGPSSGCPGSVAAYLVNGSSENSGVIDLQPEGPADALTDPLGGQSK